MGKNYSMNNSGSRKSSDFYETPFSMTRRFLESGEDFPDGVWLEPASGDEAIVRVVREKGYKIDSVDIRRGVDFLSMEKCVEYSMVITNPPYSLAFDFIVKSKIIATRKVCLLLPLGYLHGKCRFDYVWNDREFPLKCVYVFVRYPMLGDVLREDGKYRTGMQVYAWYVWEKGWPGEPMIRWIDNDSDILHSGDEQ